MTLMLGKLPPKVDARSLKLANYLEPAKLPSLLPAVNWSNACVQPFNMDGNDRIGDCVCASLANFIQVITANADGEFIVPEADVLAMYEQVGHYVPGDPSTDNGATELDGMNYLRQTGLGGVKADAFADVNYQNLDEVKMATMLFGGCYIGITVCQGDMDAFQAGNPWDTTYTPGNALGGHAVAILDYDADGGNLYTWTKLQRFTWDWFKQRVDESHALVMYAWVSSVGTAPSGLNLQQLEADVTQVSA